MRYPPSGKAGVTAASFSRNANRLAGLRPQDLKRFRQGLSACVEAHVGLRIEGGTAGEDRLQVVHRLAARGHGPQVALGRDAAHMVFGIGRQPDGRAVAQQEVEADEVADQPARRGDDRLGIGFNRLLERAALVAAVGVLP